MGSANEFNPQPRRRNRFEKGCVYMTTIYDLWYGNIHPVENFLENNNEYKRLIHIVSKELDRLSGSLSPEQAEQFEKFDTAAKQMNAVAEAEAFKYGFSLSLSLIIESIN